MSKNFDFKNPINMEVQEWCQSTCEDLNFWYTEDLNVFPYFIKNEYLRLRSLLKHNQPFGFLMELKDVLELLIKTSVVLNLAKFVNGTGGLQENDDFYKVLGLVFDKLELGKWMVISREIIKFYDNKYPNQEFLEKNIISLTVEYFGKDKKGVCIDVPKWRNTYIGHGALNFNFDKNIQEMSQGLLIIIKNYMIKVAGYYNSFDFYYEEDDICCKLSEANEKASGKLFGNIYIVKDQEKLTLSPFLKFIDGKTYVYESYLINYKDDKKNRTTMLEYAEGEKFTKQVEQLNNLYQQTESHCKLSRHIYIDGEAYLEDEEDAFLSDSNSIFQRPDYLVKILTKELKHYNSGIFLLQMMSGMGKSTFAKMLDQNSGFSSKNHISIDEFSVRAYYIDSDYSASIEAVKNELPQKLKRTDNNRGIKGLRSYFETKEAFADLLNKAHNEYLKFSNYANVKSKLLLIIDGLDELSGKTDAGEILHLIPEPELLEEGVFILLTCRTNEELSDSIWSKIQGINLTKRIIISSTNPDNISFINDYLRNTLSIEDTNVLNLINQVTEGRILRASLLRFLPEYIEQYTFLTDAELCKVFLEKLNLIYTNKYYREIEMILLILAMSDFPIRKNFLDDFLSFYSKDFFVKGMLRDISPLITKLNVDDGVYYTISHNEFRKFIICSYGAGQVMLIKKSIQEYDEILKEGEYFDFKEWFVVYFIFKHIDTVLPKAEKFLLNTNNLLKLIQLISKNVEILKKEQMYENYMVIEIIQGIIDILAINSSITIDDDISSFIADTCWYANAIALLNLGHDSLAIEILKKIKDELAKDCKKLDNNYIIECMSLLAKIGEILKTKDCQIFEETKGPITLRDSILKASTKEPHINFIYTILGLNIPLSCHMLRLSPREYVLGVLDGLIEYLEKTDLDKIDLRMLKSIFDSTSNMLKNGLRCNEKAFDNDEAMTKNVSYDIVCAIFSIAYNYKERIKNSLCSKGNTRRESFTEEFSDFEKDYLRKIFKFYSEEMNFYCDAYGIKMDLTQHNVQYTRQIDYIIKEIRLMVQALYNILKYEFFRYTNDIPKRCFIIYSAKDSNCLGVQIELCDRISKLGEAQQSYQPAVRKTMFYDDNWRIVLQCRALESKTINALKILVDPSSSYYECQGESLAELRIQLQKVLLFQGVSITVESIKELFKCLDEEYYIIYKSLGFLKTDDFLKILYKTLDYKNISEIHKKVLKEYIILRENINQEFNIDAIVRKLKSLCFDKKLLYFTNELKREVKIREIINQIGKDTKRRNCVMDLKRADWHTLTYAKIAEILK